MAKNRRKTLEPVKARRPTDKQEVTAPLGRLLSGIQTAHRLGTSYDRVRNLIAAGELTAVRNSNGRLAGVYEADCDAWVERSRRAPTPAAAVYDGDAAVDALLDPEDHVFE